MVNLCGKLEKPRHPDLSNPPHLWKQQGNSDLFHLWRMHQCRRDILQRPFMILSLVYILLFIFLGYSQFCPLIGGRNNRTDKYFYISFFAKCLTLQFIQIDRLTSLGIKSHFAANHIAGTLEKKEDGATNSKKTTPIRLARPLCTLSGALSRPDLCQGVCAST